MCRDLFINIFQINIDVNWNKWYIIVTKFSLSMKEIDFLWHQKEFYWDVHTSFLSVNLILKEEKWKRDRWAEFRLAELTYFCKVSGEKNILIKNRLFIIFLWVSLSKFHQRFHFLGKLPQLKVSFHKSDRTLPKPEQTSSFSKLFKIKLTK